MGLGEKTGYQIYRLYQNCCGKSSRLVHSGGRCSGVLALVLFIIQGGNLEYNPGVHWTCFFMSITRTRLGLKRISRAEKILRRRSGDERMTAGGVIGYTAQYGLVWNGQCQGCEQ